MCGLYPTLHGTNFPLQRGKKMRTFITVISERYTGDRGHEVLRSCSANTCRRSLPTLLGSQRPRRRTEPGEQDHV
jgi:hypothetical protein